ncbi:hypothetical protein VPH35_009417 [Triticum aestivum]|uniref:F-box protein At5g03100 n=1 Tax=Triticum aestivum TaxID=4565 RepID=UPI001D0166A7|nr:F-box protein At5g03100-like [Triticum aestivum]
MRGRDLTGSLPDDVLQHVLSFLPSRDAVQTSVLAPRWRHLWKSTPAVRVRGRGDGFRLFVNSLLRHRNDASPLHTFEIDDLVKGPQPSTNFFFDDDDDDDEDVSETDPHPDVDLWIRHALSTCRATSLTARFDEEGFLPWRPRPPFAFTSSQLTTMHLEFVELADGLLDFSPCPALLRLSLSGCRLSGDAIVSPSLERLTIIRCDIPIGRNTAGRAATMRISAPNLRHLQISDSCDGEQTPPSLDSMPLLTTASIRFTGSTQIYPTNGGASLLLHGLSEATSLELAASTPDGKAILQGDLRWCPTFTELKTLILNEWCLYDDVTALACLLRHTPALETLQLDFKSSDTLQEKTKGSCIILKELFPTLENLKTVKIGGHCSYSDTKKHEILKFFSDWGIPRCKVKYALNFEAVDAAMEGGKRKRGSRRR